MSKTAVIVFGPPGSGKGTQAVLLADHLRIPHISTGDIFRLHVQANDALGQEVQAIMQAGRLAPDELVNRIVEDRLKQPDCASGFILDGYPRTRAQAQALGGWLKSMGIEQVVVNLAVDYNVIVARISSRRQCPVCGASYNLVSNPPRHDEVCDRDGSALKSREDDQEAVVRQRFQAYEQQTVPLLDHFRSAGCRFYEVDGNHGTPESIANSISGLVRLG
jgi:adenylate kinase